MATGESDQHETASQFRPSHKRPLSADLFQTRDASMLYSILPSAVQSRLPRLPSIRRSVSVYGLSARRKSVQCSGSSSGSTTPEIQTQGAIVLLQEESAALYEIENMGGRGNGDARPSTVVNGNDRIGGQTQTLGDSEAGINWKYANQGTRCLQ